MKLFFCRICSNKIEKIINYVNCNSYCRVCDNFDKYGKVLYICDCWMNWLKSVKVIELDKCL